MRRGILILCDSMTWERVVVEVGAYTLTCRFESTSYDFGWHMARVHAPHCNQARQEVWWESGAIRSLFAGPWVIGDIASMLLRKRCAPERLHT